MTAIFKTGQRVLIECDGHTVPGTVILGSSNGRSLMLGFEGLVDGHLGMMPVLQDDAGEYRALMSNTPVILRAMVA
jgi:hypothetical protein